ncbi:MAG TPA: toll/interleukin-1 receptor domain-containing protein [Blastocatellia bacterium]|nr:toll/interleukin-1 receptor domain-containing protein [Blastocatellia bacterium]
MEDDLLTHLEDSGSWFYRHLISLANAGAQAEAIDSVPAEWESLVSGFWEMASEIDGRAKAEISVFLSYCRQDLDLAREIADKLREKELAVWHDELESRVGEPIIEMISKGIDEANVMVVLVSRASMMSSWVRAEVEIAVKRNLLIFPVLIEDCIVHSALQGIVYGDFRVAMDRPKQLDLLTAEIIRKAIVS